MKRSFCKVGETDFDIVNVCAMIEYSDYIPHLCIYISFLININKINLAYRRVMLTPQFLRLNRLNGISGMYDGQLSSYERTRDAGFKCEVTDSIH